MSDVNRTWQKRWVMDGDISEYELYAYVDNQLLSRERYELAMVIENSPDLLRRVRELRQMKSLLRMAYQDSEEPVMA